mmetsp:Transcript_27948/g.65960  ORF Transcript_27948/g.65960 Transcript_27948/m.65960 type:complete len:337 (+) Transcript_27948:1942-2952(+)
MPLGPVALVLVQALPLRPGAVIPSVARALESPGQVSARGPGIAVVAIALPRALIVVDAVDALGRPDVAVPVQARAVEAPVVVDALRVGVAVVERRVVALVNVRALHAVAAPALVAIARERARRRVRARRLRMAVVPAVGALVVVRASGPARASVSSEAAQARAGVGALVVLALRIRVAVVCLFAALVHVIARESVASVPIVAHAIVPRRLVNAVSIVVAFIGFLATLVDVRAPSPTSRETVPAVPGFAFAFLAAIDVAANRVGMAHQLTRSALVNVLTLSARSLSGHSLPSGRASTGERPMVVGARGCSFDGFNVAGVYAIGTLVDVTAPSPTLRN